MKIDEKALLRFRLCLYQRNFGSGIDANLVRFTETENAIAER
jgi:hypothetical protein